MKYLTINNTERINSIFKDGDIVVYSPVSPNPKQIPYFRMEYKSEGFGDILNRIKLADLIASCQKRFSLMILVGSKDDNFKEARSGFRK